MEREVQEQRQADSDPDPDGEGDELTRVGDCLHASFPADNHDSLDGDTTRLLLHLSRDPKPGSKAARADPRS